MATILLSAAGAAIGSGFGGTVLGLSGAVIGRAIGATVGRVIDQKILGSGSESVEVGRMDRLRLLGASEGTAVPRVWGRVRISGQVIWASRFQENVTTNGGGKGSPRPKSTQYSYSISLAVALCQGEINGIGRIWADGNEIEPKSLNLRVYRGDETQLADPKISVVEGAQNAPTYRGVAYVVIEDLDLSPYGNRVPQFSFEVVRPAQGTSADAFPSLSKLLTGVCIIPGTGEYALATTPVFYTTAPGSSTTANVNTPSGKTDFVTSLDQLGAELPFVANTSLIVSWFGSDLRCPQCQIKPKVEQNGRDGVGMPWMVSGVPRAMADVIPMEGGSSIYGGTPTDASVIEAITALKASGKDVTFYPFILMDQIAGNSLSDPWTGASAQPALPWRGRITLPIAPGQLGTTDRTAPAQTAVDNFFGTAAVGDFGTSGGAVTYSGPDEWRYRRFILHYAKLCALAGGVDSFCIGSEMRGLTQIRGAGDSFPAVNALRTLAGDVRTILGAGTKITYAADWSEYFGYHADGNVYFHLDPLWSDPQIDYVGIDNYMPLADWRDGTDHADAAWGDPRNVDYLKSNIAGGEGFDWYYDSPEGEAAQVRRPIEDGAFGEPWIFRYKDLKSWWGSSHHERINGLRTATPSAWQAYSKPIRFTEFGCAAIDRGANQPNRFLDPKSSESGLPKYSNGDRDDLMQTAYFQAMSSFWNDPVNNPMSPVYAAPMLDYAHSLAWAWDARPFPVFPNAAALWSDGDNFDRGHWINGRSAGLPLASVIAEVGQAAGIAQVHAMAAYGIVRGYVVQDVASARSILQPLLLAADAEAVEREGKLQFFSRKQASTFALDMQRLAKTSEIEGRIESTKASGLDNPKRIAVSYVEAEADHAIRTSEAVATTADQDIILQSELPLALTNAEAYELAERWMYEARIARETLRFALPRSMIGIGAGDVVQIENGLYRIDRLELGDLQIVDATKVQTRGARAVPLTNKPKSTIAFLPDLPVYPVFLDLPMLTGAEVPYAPHVAATANPWKGDISVWSSSSGEGFTLNQTLGQPAMIGQTETLLSPAPMGVWDNGPKLRVHIEQGNLSSAQTLDVFAGANSFAIGDGTANNWEIVQFVNAELVQPNTYDVFTRLRGQAGSNVAGQTPWPIGSTFVLLNSALKQLTLPSAARGLDRYYRTGWAEKGYANSSVVANLLAFQGIGLRPYTVGHLKVTEVAALTRFDWVRRTRVDGDNWLSAEVPLSEETESYTVTVMQGTTVLRRELVAAPTWDYTMAMKTTDGLVGAYQVSIAQNSTIFGEGPGQTISVA
ncbi:MAG: hypothetical protein RIR95_1962 [Pseudomonadota bacterium]